MILLKRVYDSVSEGDGKRILVDRLWPRGLKREKAGIDEWMKDIAPSSELREWFSHDPAKWEEFKDRYKKELKSKDKSALMEYLRKIARKGKVTLLFSSKDIVHNNAAALKALLEE